MFLLALLALGGCRPDGTTHSGNVTPPEIPPDTIGPEDLIKISVYGEESLSGEFTVDHQGLISYPLLGSVSVAGLQAYQIAEKLTELLLDGYLHEPHVTATVLELNSRKISVVGQVQRPGRYPYRAGMTLVEAIAEAGGTTDSALLTTVLVTRTLDENKRYEVRFRDITLGREPDFVLFPKDLVLVQESAVR